MHLLEPVAHLPERLAETALERRLELLLDGGAHLVELAGGVALQRVEARLDGDAQLVEALLVGRAESAPMRSSLRAVELFDARPMPSNRSCVSDARSVTTPRSDDDCDARASASSVRSALSWCADSCRTRESSSRTARSPRSPACFDGGEARVEALARAPRPAGDS